MAKQTDVGLVYLYNGESPITSWLPSCTLVTNTLNIKSISFFCGLQSHKCVNYAAGTKTIINL